MAWTVIKNSTVERLGLDSDQKLDSGKAWTVIKNRTVERLGQ